MTVSNLLTHSGTLNVVLTAGQGYDVKLEYYEAGGGAIAKLLWSSASQPEEIIPTNQTLPAP